MGRCLALLWVEELRVLGRSSTCGHLPNFTFLDVRGDVNEDETRRLRYQRRTKMKTITGIAAMLILALASIRVADAQSYSVLYNFTGGQDGGLPKAGVTFDQAGNMYGTT